jgi:hypothetical protein
VDNCCPAGCKKGTLPETFMAGKANKNLKLKISLNKVRLSSLNLKIQ